MCKQAEVKRPKILAEIHPSNWQGATINVIETLNNHRFGITGLKEPELKGR
jgi:hypothetical protein